MNNTSAVEVICQALWPGPGPAILLVTLVLAAVARTELLTYASKSAKRSSTLGSAARVSTAANARRAQVSVRKNFLKNVFIYFWVLGSSKG